MFWYFSLLCSTRAGRILTHLARKFDIIITTSLTKFILTCLLRTLVIYHPHYYTPHPVKLHKTCHVVPSIVLQVIVQFMFQYFVLNKKFIMFDKRFQDSNTHLVKKFDLIITTSFTSYCFEKTIAHIWFIFHFSIDWWNSVAELNMRRIPLYDTPAKFHGEYLTLCIICVRLLPYVIITCWWDKNEYLTINLVRNSKW